MPGKKAKGDLMRSFRNRVRFIAACFFVIGGICVLRLFFLQVVHGSSYAALANRQFTEPQNPLLDRGTIYFSAKDGAEIAAATIETGTQLALQPPKLTDPEAAFSKLQPLVPSLSHDDFIAKATKPGAQYVLVASHLSTMTGAAVDALNIPGVLIEKDQWRYYPGASLAAQELGFVAYDGDELDGRYGLEKFYDDKLVRQDSDLYANFFVQLFSGVNQIVEQGTQGDLVTTIEPAVQTELERELQAYMDKWHAQVAGGIIMDPSTGAIYAMGVNPTFDLNAFGKQTDPSIYNDPLAQSDYEMGSIVKPLTMAAGLDAGVVTPDTTYNDTGCITVDTAKICNFDLKARGVIPMQQVLDQSLNVGASYVATQLGPDRMRDYFLNHYELGSKTGIDLPGEVSGLMSNLQSPRQVEYDTASFGQGIAMTPLQTVRALASLGNGGKLVTPHLVKAVRLGGIEQQVSWPAPAQAIKPETSVTISRMLAQVGDIIMANGPNGQLALPHYTVAAKTGTAQIAMPGGGGYYPDTYLHSFFGYFPAYDPKFIIFLYGFKPQGAEYSSQTWSAIFHDLTLFLINYYDIPPDR